MWNTETLWFEIAIVSIIFALGNITMGHFEEQTTKLRRVGKYLLTLLLICSLSVVFRRQLAMTVLSLTGLPILYVHGYYSPSKKGINGWTGEPRSKYYAFRSWDKNIFKES